MASFFRDAASNVADRVGDAMDSLKKQVEELKEEKLKMLREFEDEKRRLIATTIMGKLTQLFDHAMRMLCELVKEQATDDAFMPECVKNMILNLIDSLFPDFKAEVKDAVMTEIVDMDHRIEHGDKPCFGHCCCHSPISFLRYTLYPYDRNVWRLIRDPFWWFFNLVSLVPRYAIAQIYYCLLFFVIDKGDEYQLVRFISDFKSLQFVNLGFLSAMIGSVQYFICTSQVPDTCSTYAPQESLFTVGLFVLQVILVWTTFGLISCSTQKGGIYHQLTREAKKQIHETAEDKSKLSGSFTAVFMGEQVTKEAYEVDEELALLSRGRLLALLIYDLIIFLICVALTIWVAFANLLDTDSSVQKKGADTWKFQASLYWIKAFYGLMSFPFLLLKVPGIKALYSHAKPTGYNPYGNTVRFLGKEEEGPVPWEPNRPWKDIKKHLEYEKKMAEKRAAEPTVGYGHA